MILRPIRFYDPGASGGGGSDDGKAVADAARLAAEKAEADKAEVKLSKADHAALMARVEAADKAEAARAAAAAKADKEGKAKADAEALKRGEHESLIAARDAELTIAKAEVDRLKAVEARETTRLKTLGERNEAKIGKLDKARQGLIPTILKADPDACAAWIDDNWDFLAGKGEPGSGTQRPANLRPDVKGIPPEVVAEAERFGKDPAFWFDTIRKTDPRRYKALTAPGVH